MLKMQNESTFFREPGIFFSNQRAAMYSLLRRIFFPLASRVKTFAASGITGVIRALALAVKAPPRKPPRVLPAIYNDEQRGRSLGRLVEA